MMAVGRVARTSVGLPVAVAEDLAGDLVVGGGRDFDELGFGWRKMMSTRGR